MANVSGSGSPSRTLDDSVVVYATGPVRNGGIRVHVGGQKLKGWVYAPPLIATAVNHTALACIAHGNAAFVRVQTGRPRVVLMFLLLAPRTRVTRAAKKK
jgi:hypothetical protein